MEAFLEQGFLEDGTIFTWQFEALRDFHALTSPLGDRFWDEMVVRYAKIREEHKNNPRLRYGYAIKFSVQEWKKVREEERKRCGQHNDANPTQDFDPSDPNLNNRVMQFVVDDSNEGDKERGGHHQLCVVGPLTNKSELLYHTMIYKISFKIQDLNLKEEGVCKAIVHIYADTGKMNIKKFCCPLNPSFYGIGWPKKVRLPKRKLSNLETQKKNKSKAIEGGCVHSEERPLMRGGLSTEEE